MSYKLKQTRNLLKALTINKNSALQGENELTKNLIREVRQSNYEKDCLFLRIFSAAEGEKIVEKTETHN